MIQSKVEEATIFFRGAELIQSANAELKKGTNEIRIAGLSPDADRNSIKVKTTKGVIVSSFEFTVDYLTDKKLNSEEIEKIQKELDELKKQSDELDAKKTVYLSAMDMLQRSVLKNVEGSKRGLSADDLEKTLDYYKSFSLETQEKLREDAIKRKELNDQMSNLRKQLNQEGFSDGKTNRDGILVLNVSSPKDALCEFTITYFVPSASWTPYYDVNVSSTDKPVKITGRAKVRQTTGIDWNDVKLSLSTARPSFGKTAPLFSAWWLQPYVRQDLRKVNTLSRMTQNAFSYARSDEAVYMSAEADPVVVADYDAYAPEPSVANLTMDDFVQQSENQLNVTYEIDLPYSIPGNGKEQSIELKTQEVPAEFKYYSATKLDTEVYVLAEIPDWEKLNLISAKANVTYDDTYVGETYIDAESTAEKLSLTLGTDRRITVKREKLKDQSRSGIFGNDVTKTFTYQFTVRNNQKVPVDMVVKDQYPKASQENIKIELLKETTTPTFNNEDVGVVSWEFELKSGETKVFKLVYSVRYPKDMELNL